MSTKEALRQLPKLSSRQTKAFRETVEYLRDTFGKVAQTKLLCLLTPAVQAAWLQYVERTPNVPIAQKLYIFSGKQPQNCLNCGKPTNWIGNRYVEHCSLSCGAMTNLMRQKKVCLEKYGISSIQSLPSVRRKMSKSMRKYWATATDRHKVKANRRSLAETLCTLDTRNYTDPERKYYVYVLLDPRKPGVFKYGNWKFDFEPFYVGKGKGIRAYEHLTKVVGRNLHKNRKINKIILEGLQPEVCFKKVELSETEAHLLEIKLIAKIGRNDLGLGPLTNLTDGGEGMSGRIWTAASRKKASVSASNRKKRQAAIKRSRY